MPLEHEAVTAAKKAPGRLKKPAEGVFNGVTDTNTSLSSIDRQWGQRLENSPTFDRIMTLTVRFLRNDSSSASVTSD
jgi:hypothetical protein